MIRSTLTSLLAALLVAQIGSSAMAQDRDDPTPLLRSEADIRIMSPGLHRIPLRADVLAEAADALSDVRILDAEGNEIPWLLAAAVPPRAPTETSTIEGDDDAWLSPSFSAIAARPPVDLPTLALPLTIITSREIDGQTILQVMRPPGVLPSALRIETSSTTFHRQAEVIDVGFGSETRTVGSATLYRIAEPVGDERLELPLRRDPGMSGDVLEIRITNDDGPALGDLSIVAIVRQPILVADLAGDATLRFGGGRLRAPRYDLARLATNDLGRRLVEADLPLASVSPARPNPAFDAAPALAWAMRPGAPIDRFRYRHMRSVFLEPSGEGLSQIRLTIVDLGVLTEALADLRVADLSGRQWPYLLEADAGIEEVGIAPVVTTGRGASTYAATFADGPVPLRTVVVHTSATFVDRDYALYGRIGDGEERVLSRGRLTRRPDIDDRLEIAIDDVRVDRFRVEIRDGADAPLTSVSLVAGVPVPDLYVAAPAGDYTLLLGGDGVAPPRYEIQRARDLILSVTPRDAYPHMLAANPEYVPPRRPLHIEDWVLWLVLSFAVLILSLLTIRAVRAETQLEQQENSTTDGADSAPGEPPGEPNSA